MATAPRFAALVATFSLLAAPSLAEKGWVVKGAVGPVSDFTTIQAAVNAAADGDMVLVKSGTYADFTVSAKSLVIEADAGSSIQFVPSSSYATATLKSTAALQ